MTEKISEKFEIENSKQNMSIELEKIKIKNINENEIKKEENGIYETFVPGGVLPIFFVFLGSVLVLCQNLFSKFL